MSQTLTLSQNIRLSSGQVFTTSQVIPMDGYDVIEVDVGAEEAELEVKVQPGDKEMVKFLMIEPSGTLDELKYAVNKKNGTKITLDSPQTFAGPAEVALLVENGEVEITDPQSLFFFSGENNDAKVKILVGRSVIAPK